MKNNNLIIGNVVNYTNGNETILSGLIVKIKLDNYFIVISNEPEIINMWNSGYNIGSEIHISQIVK